MNMENQIDTVSKTTTNDQDTFEIGGLILKRNPGRYGYDLTGGKFGRLTVIKQVESIATNKNKSAKYWLCKCDCGNIVEHVRSDSLLQGKQKSCGCHKIDYQRKKHLKYTNEIDKYLIKKLNNWITNCYNPKDILYRHRSQYNITVCDEWRTNRDSFLKFIKSLPNYNEDTIKQLYIIRIDKLKGYNPDNICITNDPTYKHNTNKTYVKSNNCIDVICNQEIEIQNCNNNNIIKKPIYKWCTELNISQSIIISIYKTYDIDKVKSYIQNMYDFKQKLNMI